MAYRQYIGARYVPLYVGDWNSTRNYEPLSIVTDGNGNSYTSLKDVPAGTQLNNRDYWILTSSFSGAIEQLRRDLNTVTDDVTELEGTVSALDGNVTALAGNVATIASNLNQKLNTNKINSVSNRKFIFMGDSYGESYDADGGRVTGWLERIGAMMGITGAQMAGSFAETGYGFVGVNGKSWSSKIAELTNDENITDFVFIGGSNDLGAQQTSPGGLKTAIVDTISSAKAKFPNAKIWLGFCSYIDNATVGNSLLLTYKIYQEAADENGCAFMSDIAYCLFDRSLLLSNQTHPNNEGCKEMSRAISTILLGGSYEHILQDTSVTAVTDGNTSATAFPTFRYNVSGNRMQLIQLGSANIQRCIFAFGPGISHKADGSAVIPCVKLTDIPTLSYSSKRLASLAGYAQYNIGGTTRWIPCIVSILLWHNYIEISLVAVDSAWIEGTLLQVITGNTTYEIDLFIN